MWLVKINEYGNFWECLQLDTSVVLFFSVNISSFHLIKYLSLKEKLDILLTLEYIPFYLPPFCTKKKQYSIIKHLPKGQIMGIRIRYTALNILWVIYNGYLQVFAKKVVILCWDARTWQRQKNNEPKEKKPQTTTKKKKQK